KMQTVGAHLPGLGELRHDGRPLVVVDERIEEHLLEGPRARVVADRGVEGVHVLGRAEPERPARPRHLVGPGGRPGWRRVERHGTRRQENAGGEQPCPHPRRSPRRSIKPYPTRLKPITASDTATPGSTTSQGATAK